MIYREQEDKLHLEVGTTEAEVNLAVTCYHGTIVKLSYSNQGPRTLSCGEDASVGQENALKGRRRLYTGSGNNPMGADFRVKHEFTTPDGKKLVYTFPDDYTGDQKYDKKDKNPTYQFIMNYD